MWPRKDVRNLFRHSHSRRLSFRSPGYLPSCDGGNFSGAARELNDTQNRLQAAQSFAFLFAQPIGNSTLLNFCISAVSSNSTPNRRGGIGSQQQITGIFSNPVEDYLEPSHFLVGGRVYLKCRKASEAILGHVAEEADAADGPTPAADSPSSISGPCLVPPTVYATYIIIKSKLK